MKLRWKILLGIAAGMVICAFLLWRPDAGPRKTVKETRQPSGQQGFKTDPGESNFSTSDEFCVGERSDAGPQKAVEETRQLLRRQGFKTDLSEFNFSTSDEFRAREAALTNAVSIHAPGNAQEFALNSMLQQLMPELLRPVGTNLAIPVWKQPQWTPDLNAEIYLRQADYSTDDLWPALRDSFKINRRALDEACEAALSGPIRFNLNASHGSAMLLPHLAAIKQLAITLGARALLELHDGNRDAAWTNVLASTRLVTAWEPEPAEVSRLVRFACATIVFDSTWQLLQSDGWVDERLARLQREWESVEFFKALPDTAAFTRASTVAMCQLERREPSGSSSLSLNDLLRSPPRAWANLKHQFRQSRYSSRGTYEDERDLLLHYRDRELEMRQAVQSPNWLEMRRLPGVTNFIPFQSKYSSRMQSMMNCKQIGLASMMYMSPGQGQSLLGRASDAESRRRVIGGRDCA